MKKKNTSSHLIKTKTEIDRLRQACAISSQLHTEIMSWPLKAESEAAVATRVNHWRISQRKNFGACSWSYPPIVGAGKRSTQLHAKPTQKIIQEGEVVLIDAGLKRLEFCADITRTLPAGKQFGPIELEIYKIVLRVQKEIIRDVRPRTTLTALDRDGRARFREYLAAAGLIKKDQIGEKLLKVLFPHRTSHWIGKKVHDPCPYRYEDGSAVGLAEGMVFTVEPGLYFEDAKLLGRSFGIRIEDVVLVTETGYEVLSTAPKEIRDIEKLRAKANSKISV